VVVWSVKYMRKPPEPAGPCPSHDLVVALRELHLHAGEPSTRAIARSSGGAISHDTVHRILTSDDVPTWKSLAPIVEALDGDVEAFRALWVSARRAMVSG
jgi:acetyl esterase/lipase